MAAKPPKNTRVAAGTPADTDATGPSFEDALARLEAIVERLESGEAPLEASLAMFEEGIALSRRCNQRLVAVERRLEVLVRRADGDDETRTLAEKEFFPDDETSEDPVD